MDYTRYYYRKLTGFHVVFTLNHSKKLIIDYETPEGIGKSWKK
jgi:hypothetical protein